MYLFFLLGFCCFCVLFFVCFVVVFLLYFCVFFCFVFLILYFITLVCVFFLRGLFSYIIFYFLPKYKTFLPFTVMFTFMLIKMHRHSQLSHMFYTKLLLAFSVQFTHVKTSFFQNYAEGK